LSDENFQFWYLNNGITITCDRLDYVPRTRAPVVRMNNVQIVNGGQTSNALFEAYQQDPERINGVVLLVRIYETRDRDISIHIAESTNSQTPIKSRDLRANDFIQRQLEETFRDMGYYYERKRGQYQSQPRDQRVDLMAAGQACLAY
jgi:AIPR protein